MPPGKKKERKKERKGSLMAIDACYRDSFMHIYIVLAF
jgi:hypothetical protein